MVEILRINFSYNDSVYTVSFGWMIIVQNLNLKFNFCTYVTDLKGESIYTVSIYKICPNIKAFYVNFQDNSCYKPKITHLSPRLSPSILYPKIKRINYNTPLRDCDKSMTSAHKWSTMCKP